MCTQFLFAAAFLTILVLISQFGYLSHLNVATTSKSFHLKFEFLVKVVSFITK